MKFSTPFHFLFSQVFEDTERERDNIVWRIRAGAPVWPVKRHIMEAEAMWCMFANEMVGMPVARVDERTTLETDFFCHDNALHRVLLNNISDSEVERINRWFEAFEYDRRIERDGPYLILRGEYRDGTSASRSLDFVDYGSGTYQNQWYKELFKAGFVPQLFEYTVGADRLIKIFSNDIYAYELPGGRYDDEGYQIMGFLARASDLIADYVEIEDNDTED